MIPRLKMWKSICELYIIKLRRHNARILMFIYELTAYIKWHGDNEVINLEEIVLIDDSLKAADIR